MKILMLLVVLEIIAISACSFGSSLGLLLASGLFAGIILWLLTLVLWAVAGRKIDNEEAIAENAREQIAERGKK